MKLVWNITLNDYFEIVKRAKAKGLKSGESMEEVLVEYMKEINKKPMGATELTKDEMLKDYVSKGKKVLNIETDDDGEQTYRIIKKKEEGK